MVGLWFNLLKKTSGFDDDAICKMDPVETAFLVLHWAIFTVTVLVAFSGLLLIAALSLWA